MARHHFTTREMARWRLTTREIAELLNSEEWPVEEWRVRRLFETGALPEPDRFAGKRAIPSTMIPEIVDALRARGWLPSQQDTAAE